MVIIVWLLVILVIGGIFIAGIPFMFLWSLRSVRKDFERRWGKYLDDARSSAERGEHKYFPCVPSRIHGDPKEIAKEGGIELPDFSIVCCLESFPYYLRSPLLGILFIKFDYPLSNVFLEKVQKQIDQGNTKWRISDNKIRCDLKNGGGIYWILELTINERIAKIKYQD